MPPPPKKARRGGGRPPYYRRGPNPPAPTSLVINPPTPSQASTSGISETSESSFESVQWGREKDIIPGWILYFPDQPFSKDSDIVSKMRTAYAYLKANPLLYDISKCKETLWMPIQLEHILEDQRFLKGWQFFHKDLVETPAPTLNCFALAIHQLVVGIKGPGQDFMSPVRARVQGHTPISNIQALQSSKLNTLMTVRGTVMRVDASKLSNTWLQFDCSACSSSQLVRQDGKRILPRSCLSKTCKVRSNFVAKYSHRFTQAIQHLRLQEMFSACTDSNFSEKQSRMPRSIEVKLTEDLVDRLTPGDDVTITAILRVKQDTGAANKSSASNFKVYLDAVNVVTHSHKKTQCRDEPTKKDMVAIKMIKEEPCTFRLLVHSLCPNIFGNEMIKAGLILGLFGGASKNPDGRRAEIHVLIVGDPGMGKSRMLQACINAAPRGVFVSGCTATKAGLTVAVSHEKGQGASVEAGALLLADQGICCIDEFDKMSSKYGALLEVMEQQTISVCKASVLNKLKARTSVFAAGNPVEGHYNQSKTVAENLRINPALLSRFDLVFMLLDQPNDDRDEQLAQHIEKMHGRQASSSSTSSKFCQLTNQPTENLFTTPANKSFANRTNVDSSQPVSVLPDLSFVAEKNLVEHLKLRPNEQIDNLPYILMQKYILHARKHCHPKISREAAAAIKSFYIELRQMQIGSGSIPVTTRQLEAICRMTLARARIDLAAEATLDHANDVIALVRHSMINVFSTDTGGLRFSRKMNGSGMSGTMQIKRFVSLLQDKVRRTNNNIFSEKDMRDIALSGGIEKNIIEIIDSLNIQGILLSRSNKMYQVVDP